MPGFSPEASLPSCVAALALAAGWVQHPSSAKILTQSFMLLQWCEHSFPDPSCQRQDQLSDTDQPGRDCLDRRCPDDFAIPETFLDWHRRTGPDSSL